MPASALKEISEASVPSAALPELKNDPGKTNWVEKAGGLPDLIKRVAKHLAAEGKPEGQAIATAVNWAQKMCETGTAFGGKVKVKGAAKAAACAAYAEWKAKAKGSHLSEAVELTEADILSLRVAFETRLQLVESIRRPLFHPAATTSNVKAARDLLEAPDATTLRMHLGGAKIAMRDTIDIRRELARERSLLMNLVEATGGKTRRAGDPAEDAEARVAKVEARSPRDELTLAKGSKGPRVVQAQERLSTLGYGLKHDGQFGPKTQQAVKSFQGDHGQKVDGVLGPNTRVTLRGADPEDVKQRQAAAATTQVEGEGPEAAAGVDEGVETPGVEGEEGIEGVPVGEVPITVAFDWLTKGRGVGEDPDPKVMGAQAALKAMGTFVGDGGPDGRFGPETEKAVKRIQRRHGLKPDGLVGPKTHSLLQREAGKELQEAKVAGVLAAAEKKALVDGPPAPKMGPPAPKAEAKPKPGESESEFDKKHPRAEGGPTGGQFVKKGDNGANVEAVQHHLGLEKSGNFDRETAAHVRQYQINHGLQADGVVGAQTARAMSGQAMVPAGPASKKDLRELRANAGVKGGEVAPPVTAAELKPAAAPAAGGQSRLGGLVKEQKVKEEKHARREAAKKAKSAAGSSSSSSTKSSSATSGATVKAGGLLESGASGGQVKAMQKLLGISTTGTYDKATVTAVKKYQRQHGLLVDGIVGAQTLSSLLGMKAAEPGTLTGAMLNKLGGTKSSKAAKAKVEKDVKELTGEKAGEKKAAHKTPKPSRNSLAKVKIGNLESKKPKALKAARVDDTPEDERDLRESALSRAITNLKRLPDGTFAPKGQGAFLSPGDKVTVPHPTGSGTVHAKVSTNGRSAIISEGDHVGKALPLASPEIAKGTMVEVTKPGDPAHGQHLEVHGPVDGSPGHVWVGDQAERWSYPVSSLTPTGKKAQPEGKTSKNEGPLVKIDMPGHWAHGQTLHSKGPAKNNPGHVMVGASPEWWAVPESAVKPVGKSGMASPSTDLDKTARALSDEALFNQSMIHQGKGEQGKAIEREIDRRNGMGTGAETKAATGAVRPKRSKRLQESAVSRAVADLKRLPDGTFAPKGQGQVLRPNQRVELPHPRRLSAVIKGIVSANTRQIHIISGPNSGKTVPVARKAQNHKLADATPDINHVLGDIALGGMASPGTPGGSREWWSKHNAEEHQRNVAHLKDMARHPDENDIRSFAEDLYTHDADVVPGYATPTDPAIYKGLQDIQLKLAHPSMTDQQIAENRDHLIAEDPGHYVGTDSDRDRWHEGPGREMNELRNGREEGMASPSTWAKVRRDARRTDALQRNGQVTLTLGTTVSRQGGNFRIEHAGKSIPFKGQPGQAVALADRLDQPPKSIARDLRTAFADYANPSAKGSKRRAGAQVLASLGGGRSEDYELALGQLSPGVIPKGFKPNDGEVAMADMELGQTFALKGGKQLEVVKKPGGAFVIAKPVGGGKIAPQHVKFVPTSLGPVKGNGEPDLHVDPELAAPDPEPSGIAGAPAPVPTAAAPNEIYDILKASVDAAKSGKLPSQNPAKKVPKNKLAQAKAEGKQLAGETHEPAAGVAGLSVGKTLTMPKATTVRTTSGFVVTPTGKAPELYNSIKEAQDRVDALHDDSPHPTLTAAADQLGSGWTPEAVSKALDNLGAQGVPLNPDIESPETIAAVIKAADLTPDAPGPLQPLLPELAPSPPDLGTVGATTAATGAVALPGGGIKIGGREYHELNAQDHVVSSTDVGSLSGKSVVVTGKIDGETRKSITQKLHAAGANVLSGVEQHPDYLVVGQKAGSKLKKARQLDLPIIPDSVLHELVEALTEDELVALLDGQTPILLEEAFEGEGS